MAKSKKTKKDEEEYILVDPDEIEEGVEYKLESWWDVFVRNYKDVPGFNALVKLLIYFFLFFILIVAIKATTGDQDSTKTKQQETTKVTVPYKEMVGNIVNYRKSTINIKINDTLYIINGDFGNNILTGTVESTNGLHNFKIKDNSIYEVKMGEEVLNNELLNDINTKIIMNNSLSDIIKNNSGIKLEGLYKYNKVVIDNVNYEIEVLVADNKVTGINVNNDNISYEIKYEA